LGTEGKFNGRLLSRAVSPPNGRCRLRYQKPVALTPHIGVTILRLRVKGNELRHLLLELPEQVQKENTGGTPNLMNMLRSVLPQLT
jgi:hypothetical protein